MGEEEAVTVGSSSSAPAIDSSNIGFQNWEAAFEEAGAALYFIKSVVMYNQPLILLNTSRLQAPGSRLQPRKGRLEPIQAYLKDNKRGIGADTSTNKFLPVSEISDSSRRKYEKKEEGMGNGMMSSSCSSTAINSSNIGFQLLKKHGWKEGTGLGISEQGRLEPVQTYLKNNKRGLGAEKLKKALKPPDSTALSKKNDQEGQSRKGKGLSKKMKKMQELEKNLQEREFERAFFREFWPDNV